jgi:hypothetical protein
MSEMSEMVWLGDLAALPAAEIAGAYNDVFGGGAAVLSAHDVRAIASGPAFLPEISLCWRDGRSGCVTGFLLASRCPGGVAHVDCVGIRRGWRGRGYLEGGFRLFSERAHAAGFGRSTFVTGRPQVLRYAERRFGARVLDELVWLLRGTEDTTSGRNRDPEE